METRNKKYSITSSLNISSLATELAAKHGLLLVHPPQGFVDLVTGRAAVSIGADAVPLQSVYGVRGYRPNATNTTARNATFVAPIYRSKGYSICIQIRGELYGTSTFAILGVGGARGFGAAFSGTFSGAGDVAVTPSITNYGVATYTSAATSVIPKNTIATVVITAAPSGVVRFFVNGIKVDEQAIAGITGWNAADLLTVGNASSSNYLRGVIPIFAFSPSEWPEPIALAISANPWQLLQKRRLRSVNAAGASGSGVGASDITFATDGVGSSLANAAGTSDITFATSGAGQSLANAAGASDITFATSGVGQSSSSGGGVGASDITFATSGAGASIASAAGSASITFTTTGVAEGQAQTAIQAAPAGRGKRRRRFILPNNAEILATQEEVNEILRAFVKPKPTKKKVARIVPLADQIEAKEETRGNEVVERISVKPVALWKPDPALYEEMVRRVVARRQRRELEFLLLAA